jgi:hypothetical protein
MGDDAVKVTGEMFVMYKTRQAKTGFKKNLPSLRPFEAPSVLPHTKAIYCWRRIPSTKTVLSSGLLSGGAVGHIVL